jgi:hypothetical protein
MDANTRIVAAVVASAMLHGTFVALNYSGRSNDAAISAAPNVGQFQTSLKVRIGAASAPTTVTAVLPAPEPAVAATVPPPALATSTNLPYSPTRIAQQGETAQQDEISVSRSGADWSPFDGVAYHPSIALDKRPKALNELSLEPLELRRIVASGTLIMTLWIGPEGGVDRATVDHSELPPMFSAPSIEAFKRLRFTPGELGGRAVGTTMKIEVTYEDPRAPQLPPELPSASAAEP